MRWHVADLLHGACADMLLGCVAALLLTCLPAQFVAVSPKLRQDNKREPPRRWAGGKTDHSVEHRHWAVLLHQDPVTDAVQAARRVQQHSTESGVLLGLDTHCVPHWWHCLARRCCVGRLWAAGRGLGGRLLPICMCHDRCLHEGDWVCTAYTSSVCTIEVQCV